jgi:hypothetical protein
MLVAEERGRIAGFRAFMRWELVAPDGVSLRCVRAVDTATHPDFQRRGVFRMLTLAGIELATSDGVDLIFNTPNQKSGAGYLTMGWTRIGSVGVMARPGIGLLRRRTRGEWNLPVGNDPIEALGRPAVEAFQRRTPLGLRTPRTLEYLQWRFGSHPTGHYLFSSSGTDGAIGRAHLRNRRRELVVSELVGDRAGAIVTALRADCRPDYTVAWFSPRSQERRLALRAGLMPVPGMSALTVMARPLRDLPVDLDWGNWDLSLGDLELL